MYRSTWELDAYIRHHVAEHCRRPSGLLPDRSEGWSLTEPD